MSIYYSISTRIWSSSTVSPSFTCTAFTTPVTWINFVKKKPLRLEDLCKNMFDNIHPAGQAVLHLHRLHHSALLAVSNLIRPYNVYFMWCVSSRTPIYNFQQAKYSISGTWSPTATVTDFTTPGMGLRMIRDVSIGTFGRGEVKTRCQIWCTIVFHRDPISKVLSEW